MPDGIPPWLNINPLEPVSNYLRGAQLGGSLAEARASQARANAALELQAQQHAQDLAFRREQAAEINDIRRQEAQLNAAKFGLELARRQQELEIEAEEAAQRAEGFRGYEKAVANGEEQSKALMQWMPKMLWKHPERLAMSIRAMQQMEPAKAPIPFTTPQGAQGVYNQRTGAPTFVPPGALRQAGVAGFKPSVMDLGNGVRVIQISPNRFQLISKGNIVGDLSEVEVNQLRDSRLKEARLAKMIPASATPEMIATNPELKKIVEQMEGIQKERQTIYQRNAGRANKQAMARQFRQNAAQWIAQYNALVGQRKKDGKSYTQSEANEAIAKVKAKLAKDIADLGVGEEESAQSPTQGMEDERMADEEEQAIQNLLEEEE